MSNSTKSTDGNSSYKKLPTWEEFINVPNYYEDCYTIDPTKVEAAWDKLGQSTLFLHLSALPALMFFGLKKTYSDYFEEKGPIK